MGLSSFAFFVLKEFLREIRAYGILGAKWQVIERGYIYPSECDLIRDLPALVAW